MATKTATYKGRTYKLLFVGKTKFGHKAKLGFMDGSKEFWVDSSAIGTVVSPSDDYQPQVGRRRPQGDCDDFCQGCPRCW